MTSKLTRDIIHSEIADFFAGVVEIHTELGGPNTVEEAQNQLTERVLSCVPEVDSEPVANAQLPISRERLKEIMWQQMDRGANDASGMEVYKLAAFALSVIDVQPVAWISQSNLDALVKSTDNVAQPVQLYRHAQPAPVVPPEQHWEELCQHNPEMPIADAIIRAASWNACRAAMLQAQSDDDGEPTDDERIMAIEGITQPLTCGNSPVIPDGWALVPIEPTRVMLNAFLAAYSRDESIAEHWQRMLEAAPEPPQSDVAAALSKGLERYGSAMKELAKRGD